SRLTLRPSWSARWGTPDLIVEGSRRDTVKRLSGLPALRTAIEGRITIKNLLNALGIDLNLEAAAFQLKQLWGSAVAIFPTAVECLRHFGKSHVGKPHRHTQFAAKFSGKRPSGGNVVDLMEALKRSIEGSPPEKGKAKSARGGKKRA